VNNRTVFHSGGSKPNCAAPLFNQRDSAIGTLLNVGSPSARERIAADLDAHRLDLMLRKEILWESETATDDEVRAMEVKLILETGANNPAIGYNIWPRWSSTSRT
jgi:hypothetical protein